MFALTGRLPIPVKLKNSQCGNIYRYILKGDNVAELYSSKQQSLYPTQSQRAASFTSYTKEIFGSNYSLFTNIKTHQLCRGTEVNGLYNFKFNQTIRNLTLHAVDRPAPETTHKNLRFKVHYPEDGKYTIQPLKMTRLGGRDPETGRIIYGKIGGGHKRNYRWVIYDRVPPGKKDPLIERVLHIQHDPNRTAKIALVGHDDNLRYIIATENMKKGDLITSTRQVPRMHVRPKPGDAHPVGALPFGTSICCIEKRPGEGARMKLAAGTSANVVRRLGDKIIVLLDAYKEVALDANCLATIGQVSNTEHNKKPIGSPNRMRWLGIRPSSGLRQRKDGRYGFKRKRKGPPQIFYPKKPETPIIKLTLPSEQSRTRVIPSTQRVT